MDLRHLRAFVTVVEQGTVSKAALQLHITQPALSRQIGDIEAGLGVMLFDRVGRRLVLTGAGEQLLEHCRSLLDYAGALNERAQLLRRGDSGLLKVAASPQLIENVLATFLHRYAECYPDVKVQLFEAVGLDVPAMLERGKVHLGVSLIRSVRTNNRHLACYPLPPIEFLAASHRSLPLGHRGSIDILALAAHPLSLLDSGFGTRTTFDAACRLAGLEQNIFLESRAPHTLLALAEAGHCVAIVPSFVRLHHYALRIQQITYERKPLREPRAVFWNKQRTFPPYAESFCKLLNEHLGRDFRRRTSVRT
jgi:DNA-binding transcriptional LysR family regulator